MATGSVIRDAPAFNALYASLCSGARTLSKREMASLINVVAPHCAHCKTGVASLACAACESRSHVYCSRECAARAWSSADSSHFAQCVTSNGRRLNGHSTNGLQQGEDGSDDDNMEEEEESEEEAPVPKKRTRTADTNDANDAKRARTEPVVNLFDENDSGGLDAVLHHTAIFAPPSASMSTEETLERYIVLTAFARTNKMLYRVLAARAKALQKSLRIRVHRNLKHSVRALYLVLLRAMCVHSVAYEEMILDIWDQLVAPFQSIQNFHGKMKFLIGNERVGIRGLPSYFNFQRVYDTAYPRTPNSELHRKFFEAFRAAECAFDERDAARSITARPIPGGFSFTYALAMRDVTDRPLTLSPNQYWTAIARDIDPAYVQTLVDLFPAFCTHNGKSKVVAAFQDLEWQEISAILQNLQFGLTPAGRDMVETLIEQMVNVPNYWLRPNAINEDNVPSANEVLRALVYQALTLPNPTLESIAKGACLSLTLATEDTQALLLRGELDESGWNIVFDPALPTNMITSFMCGAPIGEKTALAWKHARYGHDERGSFLNALAELFECFGAMLPEQVSERVADFFELLATNTNGLFDEWFVDDEYGQHQFWEVIYSFAELRRIDVALRLLSVFDAAFARRKRNINDRHLGIVRDIVSTLEEEILGVAFFQMLRKYWHSEKHPSILHYRSMWNEKFVLPPTPLALRECIAWIRANERSYSTEAAFNSDLWGMFRVQFPDRDAWPELYAQLPALFEDK